MKKRGFKAFLTSPAATALMFIAAVGLLLFASIGGARAALRYFSETYASRVQMFDIGVSLLENDTNDKADKNYKIISYRDYKTEADGTWNEATGSLLLDALPEGGADLILNKEYPERLRIQNTGNINHYARVTINKYWIDQSGKKMTELSPKLIDLHLVNIGKDGWLIDTDSTTEERTVLYYSKLLDAGQPSVDFADTIKIDSKYPKEGYKLTRQVKQIITEKKSKDGKSKKTLIQNIYAYDGVSFQIEITVDAVQEHNAQEAILSAWGRKVDIKNNTLSGKKLSDSLPKAASSN